MILTDTHTHLYLPEFSADIDLQIAEAKTQGIERFFLPNVDSSSIDAMHGLEKKYPENCFAMMGLHPCSVKENWKEELDLVEKKLSERKYSAVGEIGMDLYWDKTFVKEQEEVFRKQIQWSKHQSLPVSIHSRESFEMIYEILVDENFKPQTSNPKLACGVFHCFTGNADQAKRAVDLGFYLGIGGVVTFKNSGLDKTLAEVDLKNIVLETDAPYLAPAPHRGKRNIPSYLKLVAEKIAAIKNVSVEEVAEITTENSRKIFGI
jgi:TatD DNase family protein